MTRGPFYHVATPLTRAGLVLGLGLGAFVDGIVLHQILGWHHLVCTTETCQPTTVAALRIQNTQDGFFHLFAWLVTLGGILLLYRGALSATRSWTSRQLAGAMLAGWGLFNVVEGIIDHHILGLHHVLPGSPRQLLFDLLFLFLGAALVIVGFAMVRGAHGRGGAHLGLVALPGEPSLVSRGRE